jgi:non-ribosomal peptide synthase protein (TIGR01720 family)
LEGAALESGADAGHGVTRLHWADAGLEECVPVMLDQEETRLLLEEVNRAYRTETEEVLVTALVQAIGKSTGRYCLCLEHEGTARLDELFEGLDLSRTVGWFTTRYPVRVDLGYSADADDPSRALTRVKEQLRAVPRQGLGYGLLRYVRGDESISQHLAQMRPDVCFTYRPPTDNLLPRAIPIRLAPESLGPPGNPTNRNAGLVAVTSLISAGRLRVTLTFSPQLYQMETIQRLGTNFVEALRRLIAHCLSPQAGGYTPADFADFSWQQADLDQISAAIGRTLKDQ